MSAALWAIALNVTGAVLYFINNLGGELGIFESAFKVAITVPLMIAEWLVPLLDGFLFAGAVFDFGELFKGEIEFESIHYAYIFTAVTWLFLLLATGAPQVMVMAGISFCIFMLRNFYR